jgi:hypothetical protein
MEVQPPAYPYDVDRALAGEGRGVYDAQCAQCHAPGGARTGTVVPVEEIGTDRHRIDMWTPAAPVAYNKYTDGYPYDFTGFTKTNGCRDAADAARALLAQRVGALAQSCSSRSRPGGRRSTAATTSTIPRASALSPKVTPRPASGCFTTPASLATATPAISTA